MFSIEKVFNSQAVADSEIKQRYKGGREGVPLRGLVLPAEAPPSAAARDFTSVVCVLLTHLGNLQSSTWAPKFGLVLSVPHYSGFQQTQGSRQDRDIFLRT